MSKEKTVNLKLPVSTALDILDILKSSTQNYSSEFPPERIVRLRGIMEEISTQIQKHNL